MNRIKELRESRGWSLAELARRADPPTTAPQIQKLERGERRLTSEWMERLSKGLHCEPADLLPQRRHKIDTSTHNGMVRGEGDPTGDMIVIPQLDVRAASGGGGLVEVDDVTEGSAVVGHFGFPQSGFREAFGAPASQSKVIEVVGDSMAPTLFPGQKVLIDLADTQPSPPGIFVIWDGLGLVLKRLEVVAHSDPLTVRIMSDNPHYQAYERTLDEAYIQARVIGFWGRL